jgi:flagellar biosynthesis repressor protein FlbT
MPLKISLKAGERLIVGSAVVRNGPTRADLLIENDVPILRGKEVMGLDEATSPCRRIYFAIQLMYVDPTRMAEHQELYWELVREVLEASPSMAPYLTEIGTKTSADAFYQALKIARRLIAYEEELMSHAANRR